ncbi:MAG: hypothetical protein ABIJ53_07145 [Verrucomicrobiota bacterium]
MRFDIATEKPFALGTINVAPSLVVYTPVDSPVRARVIVHPPKGQDAHRERAIVRVFDPDEKLTHWQYQEPALEGPLYNPRDTRVLRLPEIPVEGKADVTTDATFGIAGKGIHQIRIGAPAGGSSATIVFSRPVEYGVMFQNSSHTAWPGHPAKMYVYVPPKAEGLSVQGGPLRILDENGREIFVETETYQKAGMRRVEVRKTEVVWTFELGSNFDFRATGFPLILCSTKDAAKTIRASVEVLPDGTVVAHKFQRRILDLMPGILAKTGDANGLFEDLSKRKAEWLENPVRNSSLLGKYGGFSSMKFILNAQNVNPKSRWGGCMHGWEALENAPAPKNHWDGYEQIPEWGGTANNLAFAASFRDPINPYYGKKELFYRAAAACLFDLLTLSESEVWRAQLDNTYPSGMNFPMAQKDLPPYYYTAGHMPKDVRDVWTEGVRRMVDRTIVDYLVSSMNQSAHYLVAYECYAQGSKDPLYEKLSRLFARRFIAAARAPGYFEEGNGICSSYIGMTHWHMARYWVMSRDPLMLEAVRRSYEFFNHTVAPEPDGKVIGGFNFNHRVSMGFFYEQYSGAKTQMHTVLPEVAVWTRADEHSERYQREQAVRRINQDLGKEMDEFTSTFGCAAVEAWGQPAKGGKFPAERSGSWIRDFSGELIAIRRPAYYTAIYVGRPTGGWYIRGREAFRAPIKDEDAGATVVSSPVTPFLGGGMSLLWTPEFGNSIVAANWSPLTHHGIVAVDLAQKRWWEDYEAMRHQLDQDKGTLVVTGNIEQQGVDYVRTYDFLDDRVKIRLDLTPLKDVEFLKLCEVVPIAAGNRKNPAARIVVEGYKGGDKEVVSADLFRHIDLQGKGVEYRLAGKSELTICQNGMKGAYGLVQVNRVEIALPKSLKAGRTVTLEYEIVPLR